MKHTKLFEEFLNEAKGDKITIRWSGFPVGPKSTIGTFIVSPKVHDQIEDEMGRIISIDFEDENVTGKLASFNDVMDSMKKSDYGKLVLSESADSSVNEANSYYIETWYKDRNGNEVQLLGSDGTSVMKKMPKAVDVDQHANRINSLRKIKPFLVGEVMYRVVGPGGRVHRTINDTIEEGLNEGYYDKPFYVISINPDMSDRAIDQYTGEGKPARVIATFDDRAEAKKFASEKRRGLKTLTKTKRKMHGRDYKVVPGDKSKLTNIKESSINEAKTGKEIEIGGVKAERFTTAGINGWKLTVDSALSSKKQIIMVPDSIGKELFDFIVKNS